MEQHYLNPLFSPRSIVVLAGSSHAEEVACPQAATLLQSLKAQRYSGTLQFVNTETSGTLADLMEIKADLAIIALPVSEVSAAIDLATRMACQAVMVLSSGVDADQAQAWHKQARRDGLYLMGPNCMGFQRPSQGLNASTLGALANKGPLALVSQRQHGCDCIGGCHFYTGLLPCCHAIERTQRRPVSLHFNRAHCGCRWLFVFQLESLKTFYGRYRQHVSGNDCCVSRNQVWMESAD